MKDPIERQDAIDALEKYEESQGHNYSMFRSVVSECAEIILDLPSAEPKTGKFIGTEYDGYADGNPVYYEWKCSACGCIFEEDEPTYRYCPNCGARMDKDD